MGAVFQLQKPRDFHEAESETLRTLYEAYARHVTGIVPADRAEPTGGLTYQATPLIEPYRLDVYIGRRREGADRHTASRHRCIPLDSVPRYGLKVQGVTTSRAPLPPSGDRGTASPRLTLAAGALAALLASACCLGPLLLLTLGISGAWIGTLTALEPYRPIFVLAAVGALYLAHRRIFRPVVECKPGEVCAVPAVNRTYRVLYWSVAALLGVALVYPYIAPVFY